MFRDIKTGAALYIYDRASISVSTDKVLNVSAPRLDKTNPAAGMVVDVSLNNGVYTFKDSADVGFTGSLVISPEKPVILHEIETQKANTEAQLSRVDALRADLPKLDAIIDQLNPEIKEKKEQREEMAAMKSDIKTLKEMVELLLNSK